MPIGCSHQFVVVKRSALLRALDCAVYAGDAEKQAYARIMLSRLHSDRYLVVLEEMAGTDSDVASLTHLGLDAHDGEQWLDFYAPHIAKLPAIWLKTAPIRIQLTSGALGEIAWRGFRHVDDRSSSVVVWDDCEFPAKNPQNFPTQIEMDVEY